MISWQKQTNQQPLPPEIHTPSNFETGDVDLEELLSDGDNSDTDMEEPWWDHLRHVFSNKKIGPLVMGVCNLFTDYKDQKILK